MSDLNFDVFSGETPLLEPLLLPKSGARQATNVDLSSGTLDFFYQPKLINTPAKAGTLLSMFRMYSGLTDYWLTWADVVDAVKGPIAGDTTFRTYYTGDTTGQGWPKKTNLSLATGASDYPHDYLETGIPKPAAPSIASITGGAGANVTVAYVQTYVTSWGEEGPPSDPVTGTGKIDATWTINVATTIPGPSTKYDIPSKRLYRTIVGASGLTNYFWVSGTDIAIATATYADDRTVNTDAVVAGRGIIPSYTYGVTGSEWSAPPTDMKNLVMGGNGIMAGSSKNILCLSEPYRPWAWPARYQKAMETDIVGIGVLGSAFVVVTKTWVHIVSGTHPSSMNNEALVRPDLPGVSKRGIATSPYGVYFPTENGLGTYGVDGAGNATEKAFTPEKWRARVYPHTLIGAVYNGRYFGFFDTGAGKSGLLFDPRRTDGPVSYLNQNVTGVYVDGETTKLYLIQDNKIYEWNGDTSNRISGDWTSKTVLTSKARNYAAYKVDADFSVLGGDFGAEQAQLLADQATNTAIMAALPAESYPGPATIMDAIGGHVLGGYWQHDAADPMSEGPGPNGSGIYLGGSLLVGGTFSTYNARTLAFQAYSYNYKTNVMELKFTKYLTDGHPKRLPSGFTSDKTEYRLSGNIQVRRFEVARSMRDLG